MNVLWVKICFPMVNRSAGVQRTWGHDVPSVTTVVKLRKNPDSILRGISGILEIKLSTLSGDHRAGLRHSKFTDHFFSGGTVDVEHYDSRSLTGRDTYVCVWMFMPPLLYDLRISRGGCLPILDARVLADRTLILTA